MQKPSEQIEEAVLPLVDAYSCSVQYSVGKRLAIDSRARVPPIGGVFCIQAFHTSQDVWGT